MLPRMVAGSVGWMAVFVGSMSRQNAKMLSGSRPNLLRQAARTAMASILPHRLFLVRGPKSRAAVSLTFDDGPHPEYTPRLLDQLAEHRIPATFFLVGSEAERHPNLVRRIVRDGHQLGNHTWHHYPPSKVSPQALADEVQRTQELLQSISGVAPSLFRPPLGKLTLGKLARIWRLGLGVVLWSFDPKDYQVESSAELISRLNRQTLRAGEVLLMHDNRPHAVGAISELAELALAQRLEFSTISQLVKGDMD